MQRTPRRQRRSARLKDRAKELKRYSPTMSDTEEATGETASTSITTRGAPTSAAFAAAAQDDVPVRASSAAEAHTGAFASVSLQSESVI